MNPCPQCGAPALPRFERYPGARAVACQACGWVQEWLTLAAMIPKAVPANGAGRSLIASPEAK